MTFEPLSSSERWIFPDPKSKREHAVQVRSRLTVNTAEAAIDGAAAGLGVTRVLSYQVAQPCWMAKLRLCSPTMSPRPRRSVLSMAIRD